jgi:hypothetical protein
MPRTEKNIHLQAYAFYMKEGGYADKAFLEAFRKKFGKSARTFWRWYKDFGWGQREAERVDQVIEEAVAELSEAGKLDPSEIILGFLDLVQHRMTEAGERAEYMKAIFATAFDRIPSADNPNPENPIVIKDILDMDRLSRAIQRIMREEQAWIRSTLLLVGEPEAITEDRILVEFVGLDEDEFRNADQSFPDDTAGVSEGDKEIPDTS